MLLKRKKIDGILLNINILGLINLCCTNTSHDATVIFFEKKNTRCILRVYEVRQHVNVYNLCIRTCRLKKNRSG